MIKIIDIKEINEIKQRDEFSMSNNCPVSTTEWDRHQLLKFIEQFKFKEFNSNDKLTWPNDKEEVLVCTIDNDFYKTSFNIIFKSFDMKDGYIPSINAKSWISLSSLFY